MSFDACFISHDGIEGLWVTEGFLLSPAVHRVCRARRGDHGCSGRGMAVAGGVRPAAPFFPQPAGFPARMTPVSASRKVGAGLEILISSLPADSIHFPALGSSRSGREGQRGNLPFAYGGGQV